jgi:glycosyltransferase involved in cell wall biosynthesis
MIAAMDRNKNPQVLLKAAQEILKVNNKVKFWFVGGFPEEKYEEETQTLVKELGIGDNVCFWGPRMDVSRICSEIDLFVQPSFRDACPLAPIEAMIWEKPVVASRTGGIPEIVAHEETGLLCEPGNEYEFAHAIIRLIKDPVLMKEMGEKGRKRVDLMFTMDRLSRDVDKIFREISGESRYH